MATELETTKLKTTELEALDVLCQYIEEHNGRIPSNPNQLVGYSCQRYDLPTLTFFQATNIITIYQRNVDELRSQKKTKRTNISKRKHVNISKPKHEPRKQSHGRYSSSTDHSNSDNEETESENSSVSDSEQSSSHYQQNNNKHDKGMKYDRNRKKKIDDKQSSSTDYSDSNNTDSTSTDLEDDIDVHQSLKKGKNEKQRKIQYNNNNRKRKPAQRSYKRGNVNMQYKHRRGYNKYSHPSHSKNRSNDDGTRYQQRRIGNERKYRKDHISQSQHNTYPMKGSRSDNRYKKKESNRRYNDDKYKYEEAAKYQRRKQQIKRNKSDDQYRGYPMRKSRDNRYERRGRGYDDDKRYKSNYKHQGIKLQQTKKTKATRYDSSDNTETVTTTTTTTATTTTDSSSVTMTEPEPKKKRDLQIIRRSVTDSNDIENMECYHSHKIQGNRYNDNRSNRRGIRGDIYKSNRIKEVEMEVIPTTNKQSNNTVYHDNDVYSSYDDEEEEEEEIEGVRGSKMTLKRKRRDVDDTKQMEGERKNEDVRMDNDDDNDNDDDKKDRNNKKKKIIIWIIIGSICCFGVLLAVILLPLSIQKVEFNEYAIRYDEVTQKADDDEYSEGLYLFTPQTSLFIYDNIIQKMKLNLQCLTRDGIVMGITVAVQYSIPQSNIYKIWNEYGKEGNLEIYFKLIAADSIRDSIGSFTAGSFYRNRYDIQNKIEMDLFQAIKDGHTYINMTSAVLSGYVYPEELKEKITVKRNAENDIEIAKNERDGNITDAKTQFLISKIYAKRLEIMTKAETESILNEAYSKREVIEKEFEYRTELMINMINAYNMTTMQFVEGWLSAFVLLHAHNPYTTTLVKKNRNNTGLRVGMSLF